MRNKFDALNEIQGNPESTEKYWWIALAIGATYIFVQIVIGILGNHCMYKKGETVQPNCTPDQKKCCVE